MACSCDSVYCRNDDKDDGDDDALVVIGVVDADNNGESRICCKSRNPDSHGSCNAWANRLVMEASGSSM